MAHTPGPWYVKFCGRQEPYEACRVSASKECSQDYEGVVYSADYDECRHIMSLDDARLIAAAPDLLVALKEMVASIDRLDCAGDGCECTEENGRCPMRTAADNARVVIAKASQGEKP